MGTELVVRRSTRAGTAPGERVAGVITRILDTVSDLAVVGFATWTLLYHLGLIFDLHTDPLLLVWVVTLPLVAWWLVRDGGLIASAPPDGADEADPRIDRGKDSSPVRSAAGDRLVALAAVLALGSAALIFSGVSALWWPGWLLAAGVVGIGLVAVVRSARTTPAALSAPVSLVATLFAAGAAVGLACISVFVINTDTDDIFYVNRAAWVADHGTIPVRDTMFSNQNLPAIRGAGVPVSSIETFQGAIAHVLHLAGGSVAYLLTPPFGVFLAVWALWRLIRHWAPRRYLLCLAVALVYLLWAGTDHHSLGSFFIERMQQGKSIFVSMLVPLLYLYLTRWVRDAGRRNAVLLVAAGIAAVGLTSSATFLVPLVCVAVAIPLAVQRRYGVALGTMLPFAYPLIVGLIVHFTYSAIDPNGPSYTGEHALRMTFGASWFGAIGWVATLVVIWIVRPGPPRWATVGIVAVVLILVAPGVFALMNAFTGAHAVLWRTIWVVPVPVLVGIVAAVPLSARLRVLAPVPALVLIAAILVAGASPADSGRGNDFVSSPSWRYPASKLAEARAIMRADRGTGPVLAPVPIMRALTIATTRLHAVAPLTSYVRLLDEPAVKRKARLLLGNFISSQGAAATPTAVRAALTELDVSMVCLPERWAHRRTVVQSSGYRSSIHTHHDACYQRRSVSS